MERPLKIAWGITGAGDYLAETMEIMRKIGREHNVAVDVLVSESGVLVVKWYRLWKELKASFEKVMVERGPNTPFVAGPLQVGHYRLFFISPMTANTAAKIVHGIADTLVTNCVAQAIKGGTSIYAYPVDQVLGSQETEIPGGKKINIRTRRVDVDNVEKMRGMEGITVLDHPAEIEPIIEEILGQG